MMKRRDCRCLLGMNKGTHFEKGAFFCRRRADERCWKSGLSFGKDRVKFL